MSHKPDAEWHAKLSEMASPEFAATYLPTIPSKAVVGSRVTGPAQTVTEDAGTATVTVPTDGDSLAISLQNTTGNVNDTNAWKVSNVDKAQ